MKRTLLFLSLFLIPLTVSAANFQAGESVEVATDGNTYAAGRVVQVTEEVRGDVFLAGETILINDRVREDAFLAGENVTINGPIGDDLHVFGETIIINGDVRGDVMAFGQKVVISPESRISGQVIIGAQHISADGWFDGDVRFMASEMIMNGLFLKDAKLHVGNSLDSSDDLDIRGDAFLVVQEGKSVILPEDAVRGEIHRELTARKDLTQGAAPRLFGGFSIFSILSRILIGAILLALLRGFMLRFGEKLTAKSKDLWKTMGYGFLVLVVPPFAGAILFLPILTIPLGVIVLFLWGTALYAGALLSGLLVANLFFPLKKGDPYLLLLGKFALGTILIAFVRIVPFVGFFLTFVIYLITLGALFSYKRKAFMAMRKAHIV